MSDPYEEFRPLMFSIAYRMLASASEAEDIVQEAFLRFHRESTAGTVIESPKAYLSTITTRLAIDQLRSARVRRERYVGTWLPEPLVTDTESDVARHAEAAEQVAGAGEAGESGALRAVREAGRDPRCWRAAPHPDTAAARGGASGPRGRGDRGQSQRERDVAVGAAAAEGEAAYGGDHRFGNLVDPVPVGEPLLEPLIERPALRHFLNVGSRSKNLCAARNDDHTDLIIAVQLLHGQRQVFEETVG